MTIPDRDLHLTRHDRMSRIYLPHGIGYVEIRTGNIHPPTGNPVIAVEVISQSVDTPAKDGRLYEQRCNHAHNMIYMVGIPADNPTKEPTS